MRCTFCGEENENDARFCVNCGRALSSPVSMPAAAPRAERWSGAVIGLSAAGLAFTCVYAALYIRFARLTGSPPVSCLMPAISVTIALAAVALFIAPTRRIPIVTAIPRILSLIMSSYSLIMLAVHGSAALPRVAVNYVLVLAPAVLYVVCAAAKPRSSALAVVHIVLTVLLLVFGLLSGDYAHMFRGDTVMRLVAFMNAASCFAALLSGLAYSLAMLQMRKKPEQ
ncbi:MAG: zinc ribbon domain-containing protein [Clostridia bacterium]|nr:zinc ribbon domain-containing protein [Clostridia bacterium]